MMKLQEYPGLRWLFRMAGPLILILILVFGIDLPELAAVLSRIRAVYFVLAVAVVPLVVFIRSERWRRLLEINDVQCRMARCFRIYFVGLMTVNVLPAFGTVIRVAFFMEDDHKWRRALFSIFEDKYYDYVLLIVMGLLSVLLLLLGLPPWPGISLLAVAACCAFPMVRFITLMVVSGVMPRRIRQWMEDRGWPAEKVKEGIERSLHWKVYLLSLAGCAVYYFAIYLLCRSLNIAVSYPQVVLIESVTVLATLVPISVLGIGTRDVGLLATFHLFGRSPEEAIALSAVLLVLRFTTILMGLPFWAAEPPPVWKMKKLKALLMRGKPSETVTK